MRRKRYYGLIVKMKQAEKKEEYISNTLLTLCALRPFSNRSHTPCKVLEEKKYQSAEVRLYNGQSSFTHLRPLVLHSRQVVHPLSVVLQLVLQLSLHLEGRLQLRLDLLQVTLSLPDVCKV